MSVQFGRWNFEGPAPSAEYFEKVNATVAPYGPDSNASYSKDGVRILYRSFRTTKEEHRETQPHVFASGEVLTWDGRLDNRPDLVRELSDAVTLNSTDVEIVAAAFKRWGDKCLGKLIGDWALSIWNPHERSVLLAKDPVGTRHLFYSFDEKQLTWTTVLDPLVLFAGKTFRICEEYIASWLTNQFPPAHITPYIGIQAVPPSCSVLLRPGKHGTKHIISKYWEFDAGKRIRYRTDAEYEEHFRSAFATAVQRRLRSDRPVLAELSGGMDSSSIVCMADLIMGVGTRRGTQHSPLATSEAECPRLDTISWFGNLYAHSEPDGNELTWICKVEEQRGRKGFHINFNALQSKETRSRQSPMSAFDSSGFACTPAPRTLSRLFKIYAAHIASQGYRVTICGIGGDHVTGREPTPTPELQNLLVRGHFVALASRLNAWAIKTRKGRMPLLWEAVREFLPRKKVTTEIFTAPWFQLGFVQRNHAALCHCPTRRTLLNHIPSAQYNLDGLEGERRLAARWEFNPLLIRDVRFPYLDRDFMGFMYAIPREQVVRVGQHRSLMRRALIGVVPEEVRNRTPKGIPPQESSNAVSTELVERCDPGNNILGSSLGIIDSSRFSEALQNVRQTDKALMRMLTRTLKLESWLRHLAGYKILATPKIVESRDYSSAAWKVA
jgi:asparagine synthase (glutamine-hydrolysing)